MNLCLSKIPVLMLERVKKRAMPFQDKVPDCQIPLISSSVESNLPPFQPPVTIGIFALVTLSTTVAEPWLPLPWSRLGPEENALVSWLKYHVRGE